MNLDREIKQPEHKENVQVVNKEMLNLENNIKINSSNNLVENSDDKINSSEINKDDLLDFVNYINCGFANIWKIPLQNGKHRECYCIDFDDDFWVSEAYEAAKK